MHLTAPGFQPAFLPSTYQNQPAFGSTALWMPVKDKKAAGGVKEIYALTGIFRDYQLFGVLPDLLTQYFPRGVPIHCYAASDGSEPYTIAMGLVDKLGRENAKDYPITGYDINKSLVQKAKEGIMHLFQSDKTFYDRANMKSPLKRFIKPFKKLDQNPLQGLRESVHYMMGNNLGLHRVKKQLRGMVKFQYGDILLDAKKPFGGPGNQPVVLLFRNAWYLLGLCEDINVQKELAANLFKNLAPGSMLIVGETEDMKNTLPLIQAAGFKNIPAEDGPLKKMGCKKYIFLRP